MDGLIDSIGALFSHQLTQMTFLFCLAALIHARQVKKEIRAQFSEITAAINGVTQALRLDLRAQEARLGKIENNLEELSSRVVTLEHARGES